MRPHRKSKLGGGGLCGVGVHHAGLRVFGRVGVSYYRALPTLVPRVWHMLEFYNT